MNPSTKSHFFVHAALLISMSSTLQGCLSADPTFKAEGESESIDNPQQPPGAVVPKELLVDRSSNACNRTVLHNLPVNSTETIFRIETVTALKRANGTTLLAASLVKKEELDDKISILRAVANADAYSEIKLVPAPEVVLKMVETSDGNLYLAGYMGNGVNVTDRQSTIYKSVDDGATWSAIHNAPGQILSFTAAPNGDLFFYAVHLLPFGASDRFSHGELMYSDDQGENWFGFGWTSSPNYLSMKLTPDGSGLFWFGSLTPGATNGRFDLFRGNSPQDTVGSTMLPHHGEFAHVDIEFDHDGNLIVSYLHLVHFYMSGPRAGIPSPVLSRMVFSRSGVLLSHDYADMGTFAAVNGDFRYPKFLTMQNSGIFYTVTNLVGQSFLPPGTYWMPPRSSASRKVLRVFAHNPSAQLFKSSDEEVFVLTPNIVYPTVDQPLRLELQQVTCR